MAGLLGAAGSVLGGIFGGKGASDAAQAQAKELKKALSQQAGQFAVTQQNVAPYLSAGTGALQAQLDLLGLGGSSGQASGLSPADQVKYLVQNTTGGSHKKIMRWLAANPNASPEQQIAAVQSLADPNEWGRFEKYLAAAGPYHPAGTPVSADDAQQAAIANLKASPLFQSLYGTGVDTILQNQSATGDLRGGNTENSLANYGSSLLAQVIQNQLSNLGGISGMGSNDAIGLGQISQNNANAQSNLYSQLGGANALSAASPWSSLAGAFNKLAGQASSGNFFGGASGGGGNSVADYGNAAINNMGSFPIIF